MKNHKRNTENGAGLQHLPMQNNLTFATQKNESANYTHSFSETLSSKVINENARVGRRFSFDDNGGGYQGL
jgi:hypothetical protein